MRFPSGQPWWQNGTPHSMQRAPWSRSSSSGSARTNSRWSPIRSPGTRSGGSARLNFLKAPSSPTLRGLFRFGLAREQAVPACRHRLIAVTLERRAIVLRHDLDEAKLCALPVVEDASRKGCPGAPLVLLDELAHDRDVVDRQ